jgi:hypothetical protein
MYRYFKVIVLSAALIVPVLVSAQDRDHPDNKGQNNQQNKRYEDKAHKDSHEWNADEDKAYRGYLQEHHKKYQDFAKAKKSQQSDYWNWRHAHSDSDRH